MIWSMMLGFILASVFFFFAMRQRAAITAQRDTMAILSAKEYLDSYAEYVEKLAKNETGKIELTNLKSKGVNGVNYDGIKGTVTDNPTEINGMVDFGKEIKYQFTGDIYVKWNKCAADMKADLYINNTLYKTAGNCENKTYADLAGPIAPVNGTFTIKAPNAPFYYSITGDKGTKLTDGKWYMDLSIDLVNGKKYTVKKSF